MEVYLDNAATTRVCPEAADIAYKTMLDNYGNPSSTHTKGREAKAVLDNARKQLAAALDCAPGEVYFTSCGSEGDNWAIINGAVRISLSRYTTKDELDELCSALKDAHDTLAHR